MTPYEIYRIRIYLDNFDKKRGNSNFQIIFIQLFIKKEKNIYSKYVFLSTRKIMRTPLRVFFFLDFLRGMLKHGNICMRDLWKFFEHHKRVLITADKFYEMWFCDPVFLRNGWSLYFVRTRLTVWLTMIMIIILRFNWNENLNSTYKV